ncbi:MAG: AEC family transporter [Opitutaceae bacterium]|nr:AEC family transporter [Opitutaceae bacterium]
MMSYGQLFLTIIPVFAMIALGVGLRRTRLISEAAESSLFNLVVMVTTPCLIFESVALNPALRQPGNLLLPPLLGFGLTLLSMIIGWYVARALGLTIGHGLRTFALTVGLTNYGYLPLPLMDALFGPESRAVLLIHNVGLEAAIWTGGVLVVSGLSPLAGWRKLINAPVIALLLAVVTNVTGVASYLPAWVMNFVHALAVCAVPLGLLMSGVSLEPHLADPKQLVNPRVTLIAWLLRLVVLPFLLLSVARWAPCSVELKRVLVVQAAMPAAVVSVIIARVYGGQPLIAVQIVLGTTILALFTIPFWLRFGLSFAGLAP